MAHVSGRSNGGDAKLAEDTKRTTIVEVGRLAGVSTKTVSRVFNDEPHVSDGLKQRVRDAAATLNYHPNVHAQALVRRRSHLIGLIYENPSPSYVVELQKGVLQRLAGESYRLVVIPVQSVDTHAGEVVGLLRSASIDGVVLAPPASDHPLVLAQLAAAGIRCARIAPTREIDTGYVTVIDDIAAAREVATHLLDLGHWRIGIIMGDPTHASSVARMTGYTQAFEAAGVTIAPGHVEPGLYTYESGLEAGRRMLARPDRPTAILAQNDDMAVGAIMAAHELGLEVPGDVSVTGFDDSQVAQITWPRVTTVRQPVFEMAASATGMLIGGLEGTDATRRTDHAHQLIVRESTAPPRAPGRRRSPTR